MEFRSVCRARLVGFVPGLLAALTLALPARAISFRPPVNYPKLGAGPLSCMDIDADGRLDLAVVGGGGGQGSLSLFYGLGDGTFAPPIDYPLGEGLNNPIGADVNGDGRLDLVVPHSPLNKVLVMLNLGGRAFAPAASYLAGSLPVSVAAGDFNGDGAPDLAVSNHQSNNICLLFNQGNGTFGSPVFMGGGSYPGGIITGDWNRDGRVDLAQANIVGSNVGLYLGNGSGGFTGAGYLAAGSYSGTVVSSDFDNDGWPDLATSNWFGHTVSLFFGNGSGGFNPGIFYPGNTYPGGMAAGDLDRDGDIDLAWGDGGTDYFSALENLAAGSFLLPIRFTSGGTNVRTLTMGDFNGDGLPDIAVGNESTSNISVFINDTGLPEDPPAVLPPGHLAATRPVLNPANGRWYVAVRVPRGISWDAARGAAESLTYAGLRGHLAALTSFEEAQFVSSAVVSGLGGGEHLWLGAYQDRTAPDYSEPGGAWRWVTGEPFDYSNWMPGEPNDAGSAEHAVELQKERGDTWNDLSGSALLGGYLVEYETAAPLQLLLVPNPAVGGQVALGQLRLGQAAGPEGTVIQLNSSDPAFAAVPPSVTVPAGATEVNFPITTPVVLAAATVTITADSAAGSSVLPLQIVPVPPAFEDGHSGATPPVFNPATGHWYQVVRVTGGIAWLDAYWAAAGLAYAGFEGHLAALTTPEELEFVSRRVVQTLGGSEHVWLGGYQNGWVSDYTEPAGGWRWVTGEPFGPGNWMPGEPNDAGSVEHVIELQKERGNTWNDLSEEARLGAYLVEYEAPGLAPSEPLVLSTERVPGGRSVTGRVTLAQPAGPGGVVVMLEVSDTYLALVPETVTVPEGATSATFPIATIPVSFEETVRIYATWVNQVGVPLDLLPIPAPPGELAAAVVSPTKIDLSWTDNCDFETAYAIWRKGGGSDWTRIAVTAPNVTRYSDTSALPNTAYQYRVRTITQIGGSEWSNEAAATTPAVVPAAPSALQAESLPGAVAMLTWADNSSNETAFAIWRKGGGTDWMRVAVTAPNITRYRDTSLVPLAGYTYRIRSIGTAGASNWTNEAAVTALPSAPEVPGSLTVAAAGTTRLELSWSDQSSSETAFAIWRRGGGSDWTRIAVTAPNVIRYSDTSASPETQYTYRLRAVNQGGASPWTPEVTATTPMPAPGLLYVRNGAPEFAFLEWGDTTTSETGFELYRKMDDGSFVLLATLPANNTWYMDYTLQPGTVHTYRVRAIGPNGPSGWSNEARWATPR
jgi:hypothetical protein